jgi:hypothetical protein
LCLFIKDTQPDEIKGILKVSNELEEVKAIEEEKMKKKDKLAKEEAIKGNLKSRRKDN